MLWEALQELLGELGDTPTMTGIDMETVREANDKDDTGKARAEKAIALALALALMAYLSLTSLATSNS